LKFQRNHANSLFKESKFEEALKIYRENEMDLLNLECEKSELNELNKELIMNKMNIIVGLFEMKEYLKCISHSNKVWHFIPLTKIEESKLSKRDLSKLYRIRSKASRLGANQFNFLDIEKAIQLDPENKLNKIELETMKKEKLIFEKEVKIKRNLTHHS
jgi:hypothetical protein